MNNYFIILGAGKGQRFSRNKPKQYFNYKGKMVINHSIDKAIKSKLFNKIIIVVSKQYRKKLSKYKNSKIIFVDGGKNRTASSFNGLSKIKHFKPKNVLIHDAARPDFSINLLKKLIKHLNNNIAVVPSTLAKDSVKHKTINSFINLDRKKIYLTQTPQAFRFKNIYNLAKKQKEEISDDVTLFENNNLKVKYILGENQNNKITFVDDIRSTNISYGIGFDIHRLVKNKKLYLGGIQIPYHSGLEGHSDGDVILHSIIDAILGATQKKDIGNYFPNIKKFKNIRSTKMLNSILENLYKDDFIINNIDINLICENPKVSKYRNKIINSLSNKLKIDKNKINLKGKTVEKLGLIGKEKAIACEAIISLLKYD